MTTGTLNLATATGRLPRRVGALRVTGASALARLRWQDDRAVATAVDTANPLLSGVYAATTGDGHRVYFEAHRDGSRALMSVLWLNADRGIAKAATRSRAVLDTMPERAPL